MYMYLTHGKKSAFKFGGRLADTVRTTYLLIHLGLLTVQKQSELYKLSHH